MKIRLNQLRVKVLIGVACLLAIISALTYYQYISWQQNSQNYTLLSQLRELTATGKALETRSQNYVKNAPRDYESYYRDIDVFYHDFQQDVSSFSDALTLIINDYRKRDASSQSIFKALFYAQQPVELTELFRTLEQDWREFKANLNDKLGRDKNEPRIEWGAKFIVKNIPDIQKKLNKLDTQYKAYLSEEETLHADVVFYGVCMTGILGALSFIWFYSRIIRRISITAAACQRVANGDFGYQIKTASDDEIDQMIHAFNSLSDRYKVMMGLLGQLNKATTIEEALNQIWRESKNYLEFNWLGFLRMDEQMGVLSLSHMRPKFVFQNNRANLKIDDGDLGRKVAESFSLGKPLLIEDMRYYSVRYANLAFIGHVVRKTGSRSMIGIPMVSSNHDSIGMLLFAKPGISNHNKAQVDLLQALSGLISDHFEHLLEQESQSKEAAESIIQAKETTGIIQSTA